MLPQGVKVGAFVAAVILLGLQFFRPARVNPPADEAASFEAVVAPPREVAAAVKRACMDCHSNETVWPWYSGISPIAWPIAQVVHEGRAHLNLSEWSRDDAAMSRSRLSEMCEEVKARSMPRWYFALFHTSAPLSEREIASLCALPGSPILSHRAP